MLQFSRNKLVNVRRKGLDSLFIHGLLDDDIYSLELDLTIRINDLEIVCAEGKWNRFTTPDCPIAVQFIKDAAGFRIDDRVNDKIHKKVGRKACRHFANLMIECCKCAKQAAKIVQWQDAKAEQHELTLEEFMSGYIKEAEAPDPIRISDIEEKPCESEKKVLITRNRKEITATQESGFIIDLHVHTSPASPCSSATEYDLIEEAKRIGLNGVCLTDHNFLRTEDQVEKLSQKHGFLVLNGNEITTDQGDMLVFGLNEDIQGIIRLQDLKKKVVKAQGFMIAAHPFRGFLVFGVGQTGLKAEQAITRPLFKQIDAVEILNGKVTEKENNFAAKVASGLNLPGTGGSDAHEIYEVGRYATRFSDQIKNAGDFLHALKSGNYSPVTFRKKGQARPA